MNKMEAQLSYPTGINFHELFEERSEIVRKIKKALKDYHKQCDLEDSRNYDLQLQIELLKIEEENARLEMDNDPGVYNNLEDGNHPSVVYWGEIITGFEDQQEELVKLINNTDDTDDKLAEVEYLKGKQKENHAAIKRAWAQIL